MDFLKFWKLFSINQLTRAFVVYYLWSFILKVSSFVWNRLKQFTFLRNLKVNVISYWKLSRIFKSLDTKNHYQSCGFVFLFNHEDHHVGKLEFLPSCRQFTKNCRVTVNSYLNRQMWRAIKIPIIRNCQFSEKWIDLIHLCSLKKLSKYVPVWNFLFTMIFLSNDDRKH